MLEVVRSGTGTGRAGPGDPGRRQDRHSGDSARRSSSPDRSSLRARTRRRTRTPGSPPTRPADKPELAIAVMLIDVTGGGGTVAAPIAQQIYSTVLGK